MTVKILEKQIQITCFPPILGPEAVTSEPFEARLLLVLDDQIH